MSINSQRVTYIEEHPNLSANEIIENWKGTELGIKRQTGLELVRSIRHIKPEPIKEREKYIPTKYRLPVIELPETPEGTYQIAKVIDNKTGEKYFIKFQNQKSLTRQFNILAQRYGFDRNKVTVSISPKEYTYTPFIAPEIADEIARI